MAAGAIGGAIAGKDPTVVSQSQDYTVDANLSSQGKTAQDTDYAALQKYIALTQSQNPYTSSGPEQYAQMLKAYSQGGFLPNQQQVNAANEYAQNIFAPQQAQLNNVFSQAQIDSNRQSAAMGRSVDDPILRAKLAQYMGQQQNVLSSQQTAFGAQTAYQIPQQQLGYAQALANQAFQNQLSVMGLGQNFLQNQQNYALATAKRNQSASSTSGGGTKGAIQGAFQGAGAETNLFTSVFLPFSSGGGSGATNAFSGGGGGTTSSYGQTSPLASGGSMAGLGAVGAGSGGAATGTYAGANYGLLAAAA